MANIDVIGKKCFDDLQNNDDFEYRQYLPYACTDPMPVTCINPISFI